MERLIQIIKASARPVNLGDVSRTGFGLPDVMVAIGLQTATGQAIARASAGSTAQPAAFQAGRAAIGSMTPQQAFAYGTQYVEQSQLSPQAWVGGGGNSWPQSLGVLMTAVDSYATYFGRQSFGNMMPGVAYGMNPGPGGFPRQGW